MEDDATWVDKWIDSIPENVYDPCPCGCGKKWKFALQDGIEKHEEQFRKNLKEDATLA